MQLVPLTCLFLDMQKGVVPVRHEESRVRFLVSKVAQATRHNDRNKLVKDYQRKLTSQDAREGKEIIHVLFDEEGWDR